MELSPDVLSYVNTVKNFLKKNEEARKYFLSGVNEDQFFDHLTDIAEKNFKSFGQPQLSREQFDLLRKTMVALSIAKKSFEDDLDAQSKSEEKIFIDYRGFGKICLN